LKIPSITTAISIALDKADTPELTALLHSIALQSVQHGITICKPAGPNNVIIYCNPAFLRMSGYDPKSVLGRDCRFMQGAETDAGEAARLGQALSAGDSCVVTLKNYRRNGDAFWNKISINPVTDQIDQTRYFVGVQEDVTEFVETESHEQQLDTILEDSLNEIFTFAVDDFRFLQVNHGARKNLGYDMAELATMTPVDIKPEFDVAKFRQLIKPLASNPQETLVFDTIHCRKNGSTYPVEVHLQRIETGTGSVFAAVVLDITRRKQFEDQLRDSHDDLRALSTRLQTIRDDERRHLSRELHDELGQLLAAARMELSLLDRALPEQSDELTKRLSNLDGLLDRSVLSIRSMVKNLRPRVLENAGLFGGIELLSEEIGRRHDLKMNFTVSGEMNDLPDSLVTPVYRLIQESLNNVAKHAQADEVIISLDRTDRALTLRVSDNGIGLTSAQAPKPSGFGLAGMRERVEILGGRFTVIGTPGEGTEVSAVLPYQSTQHN